MRNRTTIIFILGLIIGISGAAFLNKPSYQRKPAWIPAPIGKHLAPIKVAIEKPSSIPDQGGDEVTITGRVSIIQNLDGNLSYSWNLPENVNLVSGRLSGIIENVSAGQTVDITLTVSGFNKEQQRHISLQASSLRGSETLGGSAVIASRPEDTLESVAYKMKQSADEQLGQTSRPTIRR
ncbi:MAG: hypothetical protein ACXVCP_06475 [Bdellovibrio sp.]